MAGQPDIDPIARPVPHIAGAQQCTGEATYIDDLPPVAGELVLIPVQSSVAHARITAIDVTEALKIEDVVAWISADDVPGRNLWGPMEDEEVFPKDEILYFGQIIGVIAARSYRSGRKAASLVSVRWDLLPAITTLQQAIKQNSFYTNVNLERRQTETEGEGSVSGQLWLGGQEHAYLETHQALAVPGREAEEMTLFINSQEPSSVHCQLSSVLNVPQNKIIVRTKRVGGGFGGKERCYVGLMAAVAAKKLRVPCRLILDRQTDFATSGHKHEVSASYDVQFKSTGKITKIRFDCDINAGCSVDLSTAWAEVLVLRVDGGYTLQDFSMRATPLQTNLVSNTAFRGFGGPEGCMLVEECIEHIALNTNLDPAQVRFLNLTRTGDLLHHSDIRVPDDNLYRCWQECLEMSDYYNQRAKVEEFNSDRNNGSTRRGISIIPMKFNPNMIVKFLNQGSAFVRIYVDGSVQLSHGGVEMGQGLHTKMVQLAAKVLGVPMGKIHITETSTETIPNATPTGGSSGTELNGHAVIDACEILADRLASLRLPGVAWEDVVSAAYMQRIPLSAFGFYNRSQVDYDFKTNKGSTFNYLTSGVACSLVEVDCALGKTHIIFFFSGRTTNCLDLGYGLKWIKMDKKFCQKI